MVRLINWCSACRYTGSRSATFSNTVYTSSTADHCTAASHTTPFCAVPVLLAVCWCILGCPSCKSGGKRNWHVQSVACCAPPRPSLCPPFQSAVCVKFAKRWSTLQYRLQFDSLIPIHRGIARAGALPVPVGKLTLILSIQSENVPRKPFVVRSGRR